MPIKTVEGKVLLGWMPREEALWALTKVCIFDQPLTEDEAVKKWEEYRDKVRCLKKRECAIPERNKINLADKQEIRRLYKLTENRSDRPYIRTIIKVKPEGLVVHQFILNTDRATSHAQRIQTRKHLAKMCLGMGEGPCSVTRIQRGDTLIFRLPHFEFVTQPLPNGQIGIAERARYISVVELHDRTLLWGGYHRTYACMIHTAPDEVGGAPLVALTTDVPEVAAFLGRDSKRPEARDTILGECPAFLSDFFDDDVCMKVRLRKQRLELHVKYNDITTTTPVWIDETT